MFYSTVSSYTLSVTDKPEEITPLFRDNAVIRHQLNQPASDNSYIALGITDCGLFPELLIEGWYNPGPAQGFHPGVLIIPETQTVFIGAGTSLLVYALSPIRLLTETQTECGFWGWSHTNDIVIMSAELELAVWNTQGEKLWSCFVEPPWHYHIQGETLLLDIMGNNIRLDLISGQILGDHIQPLEEKA